jgi:glycosyltransferase involved in cell wall biosynthesis
VPSYRSLLYFKRLSINAELISVGVDVARFRAAGREEKRALRKRYAFDEKSYIFLHVGHLSPRRNLSALLCLLQLPDSEIVLVGSTSTPASTRIRDYLESRGVRVIRKPVPVEDFYRLSDCYVFPAEDTEGAIEIPLSIVEALASGLPVLTTPFGGLKDHLAEGGDIRFWNSEAELLKAARAIRSRLPSSVRSMEAFSWDMIAERMTTILGRTR